MARGKGHWFYKNGIKLHRRSGESEEHALERARRHFLKKGDVTTLRALGFITTKPKATMDGYDIYNFHGTSVVAKPGETEAHARLRYKLSKKWINVDGRMVHQKQGETPSHALTRAGVKSDEYNLDDLSNIQRKITVPKHIEKNDINRLVEGGGYNNTESYVLLGLTGFALFLLVRRFI